MEIDNHIHHQVYSRKKAFETAHVNKEQYQHLYEQSINDTEQFWGQQAKAFLTWSRPFDSVLEGGFQVGDVRWFSGGRLNASFNCIDRHLKTKAKKTAILWEGDEPNQIRRITYEELLQQTCRIANVLRTQGVQKGDRVVIYMPMIPEAAFSMLACARVGAIHSVVFGGFSAVSLRERVKDADAKVVITADVGVRGGKVIPLKKTVDEALKDCHHVKKVLVFKHPFKGTDAQLHLPKEQYMFELMEKERPYCPPVDMDSEDPLFMLYTSGSTGKPKGVVHTTAGYLLQASITHKLVFDCQDDDIYACVADIGWITGHSYIVYGPLLNGVTTFMFESHPMYPDASRYWDMVERHRITILYTAPTAIRTLMSHGNEYVKKHDRSSLRILGSVGEPINPEAWIWYHDIVGEERCAIVDTYWQTETGGHVMTPLPGVHDLKPGSAVAPFLGIDPAILDPVSGELLTGNGIEGVLVIRKPWPGMTRTVWGDHSRYLQTYFSQYKGYYFTGDGCKRDSDGYIWITGRVDDVINKSGHRLSTAEIEAALTECHFCAEAAVVAIDDDIRGSAIVAYCILVDGTPEEEQTRTQLKMMVRSQIGSLAVPDTIILTPSLPKTRSGKIMRRILRKIASGQHSPKDLGDISTLADPDVVAELIKRSSI
eukprot:TRINITY_DN5360_c0_g1_i1.p1 TRINITY_DN5360_c0_g1~~TRINITY_DN5360_c0_g1_i1.p1  ORF type:complete len:655 (-),score=68.00 TRINITY_DN5360_c0_g1_i1:77-2041(-)